MPEAALKRLLDYCEEMADASDVLRVRALEADDGVAAAVHAEGRNTNRDVARRIRQELEGDRP